MSPGVHRESIMAWSADAMTTVGSDQRGAGLQPWGMTLL